MGKKIRRVLVYLSIIFAIGYYVIQTYNSLFAPCAKLKAVVQHSSIRFPPKLKDEIKELEEINKKVSSRSTIIEKQIINDLKFDGYWSANVKNRGNTSCKDVSLTLPHSEIFMIKRENSEIVIDNSKHKVSIGNLAPLEAVMVYGWTCGYEGITFNNKSSIKLTHEKGIGTVRLNLHVRDYWYYISKNWVLVFILWTVVLNIVLYMMIKLTFFIIKKIKRNFKTTL